MENMDENSEAIVLFCSHLAGEGAKPLGPKEWSDLSHLLAEKNLSPAALLRQTEAELRDMLGFDSEFASRLRRLADRKARLAAELEQRRGMGIHLITAADEKFPAKLKEGLGKTCPPLLYCAGDLSLLGHAAAGYVGSRRAEEEACAFARRAVEKTAARGYGVVSGGARGIDSVSAQRALELGSFAIEYLADDLTKCLQSGRTERAVEEGRLLLLTAVAPGEPFHIRNALIRNKFIYTQSEGTVVVRADFHTGGTWRGATEALFSGRCTVFCWENANYPGNLGLIAKGAVPIGEGWDGDLASPPKKAVQTSLFD